MSKLETPTPGVAEDGLSQELVPEDDAVIGRAVRWSVGVLLIIVLLVVAVLFSRPDDAVEETVLEKDAGTISDLARPQVQIPSILFADITEQSGLDFVHVNGATGEKLLPETMGGGCAFADVDSDGDQDLVLVGSRTWPHASGGQVEGGPCLYRNDGTGRFERDRECGLEGQPFYGMGVAVGDVDGDGQPDLFFTAVGSNHLYRNTGGGRFVEDTQRAGVAGAEREWSTSAGFFDADQDGDLDLFVCNYVHWSREIDQQLAFTFNGRDRAYGPPTNYTGTQPYFYLNDGQGVFREAAEDAGMHVCNDATGGPVAKSLGVTFSDVDRDGRLDVIVANDTVQNFVYRNLGEGRFEEIGDFCGIGYDARGLATGAMGIDAACYRNDDCLGVAIGNFANEMTSLYVSEGGQTMFLDDAITEGIGSPSRAALSFGLFFFDADLDGRLDLLQTNGHLDPSIQEVQASQRYHQPAQLFWNAGPEQKSCYTLLEAEKTGDLARPIVGRGATYADIDSDGDLDVFLTQVGERPLLLRNQGNPSHHWLRCRLVGPEGNSLAIGAQVELRCGGVVQHRVVMPTRSYLSQVELPLTFGLGTETRVTSLVVTWPNGQKQTVNPPDTVDCEIVIRASDP